MVGLDGSSDSEGSTRSAPALVLNEADNTNISPIDTGSVRREGGKHSLVAVGRDAINQGAKSSMGSLAGRAFAHTVSIVINEGRSAVQAVACHVLATSAATRARETLVATDVLIIFANLLFSALGSIPEESVWAATLSISELPGGFVLAGIARASSRAGFASTWTIVARVVSDVLVSLALSTASSSVDGHVVIHADTVATNGRLFKHGFDRALSAGVA